MKKSTLLIGAGAAAVYLLVRGTFNTAQALKNLAWGNPKIKVINIGLLNMDLQMSLDITNPNSADVPLDYFTGIISYQGTQLTSFTFNANGKNVVIKGRSVTPVPFTLVVKNANTISAIVKLISALSAGNPLNTLVTVTGSLFAAGFDVPVKFSYDLKSGAVSGVGEIGKFNFGKIGTGIKKMKLGKGIKKGARNLGKGIKTGTRKLKPGLKSAYRFGVKQGKQFVNNRLNMLGEPLQPVSGIAGVKAQLEFSSNKEMEKYFAKRESKQIDLLVPNYSKN